MMIAPLRVQRLWNDLIRAACIVSSFVYLSTLVPQKKIKEGKGEVIRKVISNSVLKKKKMRKKKKITWICFLLFLRSTFKKCHINRLRVIINTPI